VPERRCYQALAANGVGAQLVDLTFDAFVPATLPNAAAQAASTWDPRFPAWAQGTWVDGSCYGGTDVIDSTNNPGFGGGSSVVIGTATILAMDIGHLSLLQTYFTTTSDEMLQMSINPKWNTAQVKKESATVSQTEIAYNVSSTEGVITIWVDASFPFPFAAALIPNIDESLSFDLKRLPNGSVTVSVSGTHPTFPNYEAIANTKKFYKYATTSTAPGFVNLGIAPNFQTTKVTL
jgi:hypothetical protein